MSADTPTYRRCMTCPTCNAEQCHIHPPLSFLGTPFFGALVFLHLWRGRESMQNNLVLSESWKSECQPYWSLG
eukprot:5142180-Amphidinium_carterae.1